MPTMVETIDIDYTKHADSILFCEEVFIQYDCIYNDAGNKVPAFQITENMAEGNKYRVNARRQQYTADHRLIYLFPQITTCLLYTSPSPRDYAASRMPSSA